MGKFYVREVGLGQSNLLLAVLCLAAVGCRYRRRDIAAGALLAVATVVKPYAILFLPYLIARRKWSGVASFGAVMLGALLLLPALRYGWSGNLDQLHGWWTVVTMSTAPNLAGQDNISIAGMYAAWLGVGTAAGALGAVTMLVVAAACAWAVWRGSRVTSPDYLDAALLLFVMPLLSPQGWDYVLLAATPAVMLLLDRLDEFPPAGPLDALRLARGGRPVVLGCPRPRTLPGVDDVEGRHRWRAVPGGPRDPPSRAPGRVARGFAG